MEIKFQYSGYFLIKSGVSTRSKSARIEVPKLASLAPIATSYVFDSLSPLGLIPLGFSDASLTEMNLFRALRLRFQFWTKISRRFYWVLQCWIQSCNSYLKKHAWIQRCTSIFILNLAFWLEIWFFYSIKKYLNWAVKIQLLSQKAKVGSTMCVHFKFLSEPSRLSDFWFFGWKSDF